MAISAKEMGYNIAAVEPTEDSPCGQVADIKLSAKYDDIEAVSRLAHVSKMSLPTNLKMLILKYCSG